MIILGLGTNLGDRLFFLRQALLLIKKIPTLSVKQVSPVYVSDALLPDNANDSWDKPYLNAAIRCEADLTPLELLQHTKRIEKEMGQLNKEHWGPRVIDIDLLSFHQLIHYDEKLHVPHEHLHERLFALWPLADVAPFWTYPIPGPLFGKTAFEMASGWGSRFDGTAPLHTRQIQQRIDTPQLMGILNLTPDSFSGDRVDINNAWRSFEALVASGADIVDIGAEATGPHAKAVSPTEEWSRLKPLLTALQSHKAKLLLPPKISIDTRHPETAQKALDLGIDWINDVSGLENPNMLGVVEPSRCDVVLMHQLGIPANKNRYLPLNQDVVSTLYQWAEKRLSELEERGIPRHRVIFDPGIGYGKTPVQDLELIKNMVSFKKLDVRLLVGHSRKSFLTSFTAKPPIERDLETIIVSRALIDQSVDIIRAHQVDLHARMLKIASSLSSV